MTKEVEEDSVRADGESIVRYREWQFPPTIGWGCSVTQETAFFRHFLSMA